MTFPEYILATVCFGVAVWACIGIAYLNDLRKHEDLNDIEVTYDEE